MFSQLFFVFLALILINFTTETSLSFWIQDPQEAFLLGLLGYLLLLFFLYSQMKIVHLLKKPIQSLWHPLVNVEVLLFLGVYHFGLGAQRFFLQGTFASYQTPSALVSLFLYFFALGWAHLWYAYFQMNHSLKKSVKTSSLQLLFYCPFCLPFILMSLLLDGVQHFPILNHTITPLNPDLILSLMSITLLGLTLIFFPAFIVLCWRCKPLDQPNLKERLERICNSLNFQHAGLKMWSIMPHSFTAGIIGVVASFRYILFTPALINRFQPEEVEAILIHEIGHHRYKHLLCYPFILLGMMVVGTLLLIGLEHALLAVMEEFSLESNDFILIMTLFIGYAVLMGIYFRLVFGFFSRLFERQADLHIFASSSSPLYLIQALDHLGVATGYTHAHPSWHHYSLQERIRFLHQAIDHPPIVELHHRKVKKWLFIYSFILIAGCLTLFWSI